MIGHQTVCGAVCVKHMIMVMNSGILMRMALCRPAGSNIRFMIMMKTVMKKPGMVNTVTITPDQTAPAIITNG